MTNTPGEGEQRPDDLPPQPPGSWEQQSQQPPQPHGQPQYGQQYGQPPVAYAPDHPKATTSLVLGILGIVVCGVIAPFAWQSGRRTMAEIDASHGQLGGRGAAQAGYVLGIIGTVLLGLGVLLMVVWLLFFVVLAGGAMVTAP